MLALTVSPVFPSRSTQQRRFRGAPKLRRPYRIFAEPEPQEAAEEVTPTEPPVTPQETPVTSAETPEPKGPQYIDELEPLPKRTPLSKEMRDRLRDEYVGLGGAENVSMGANWFLYISITIAVLAIASYLTGAI